jgi:hypothetical protein
MNGVYVQQFNQVGASGTRSVYLADENHVLVAQ